MRQRVVIVLRGGALAEAYADPDVDLVLVDFDEQRHGASVEIVPDTVDDMPADIRRLAVDAKERAQ